MSANKLEDGEFYCEVCGNKSDIQDDNMWAWNDEDDFTHFFCSKTCRDACPFVIEDDDETDSECETDEDVLKISFTRMMSHIDKCKELNGGKIDKWLKEILLTTLDALEKRKAILETRQENADEPEYEAEPCEDCGKLITEDETKCYSQGCISVNCCEECYDKNRNNITDDWCECCLCGKELTNAKSTLIDDDGATICVCLECADE